MVNFVFNVTLFKNMIRLFDGIYLKEPEFYNISKLLEKLKGNQVINIKFNEFFFLFF